MKKKTDYLNELEYIKDWCVTIIDFKLEMKEIPDEIKKLYEPLKIFLITHFNSKDKNIKKGFKETYNNLKEEVSYWPEKELIALNNIMYLRFGEKMDSDNDKKILKILKRGRIRTDDEFRIIDERVNEICQTNPESSKLDILNHLLFNYEQSKK